MSPAGFVVLVVVGTSDPNVTSALVEALTAALAPEVYVVQGAQVDAPVEADRTAERMRAAVDASGKVLVDWAVAGGAAARVRLQRTATGRWVERRIEFAAGDPPRERGRLVGLVCAAIWRAMVAAEQRSPPSAPVEVAAVPAAAAAPVSGRRAADAAAVFTTGLGGTAGRWGASLAARWRPAGGRLGWRAGLDARAGEIPAALASVYTLVAGLGASLTLLDPGPRRPLGLDVRADLVGIGEIVSHLSSDDRAAVRRARWLPGVDGAVEVSWHLSSSLAVLVGGGVEVAAGPTDVVVRQETAASISAFRLVSRAGLRTRF